MILTSGISIQFVHFKTCSAWNKQCASKMFDRGEGCEYQVVFSAFRPPQSQNWFKQGWSAIHCSGYPVVADFAPGSDASPTEVLPAANGTSMQHLPISGSRTSAKEILQDARARDDADSKLQRQTEVIFMHCVSTWL